MAPDSSIFDLGTFTAAERLINGKRAVTLLEQHFGSKPKQINIIVQQELPGFDLFPATWEYVNVPAKIFDLQSPRDTALRIVAAPGISVHLESWPTAALDSTLEVFRIQDPEVLPPQATTILSDYYAAPQELNAPPSGAASTVQYPLDYFIVESNQGETVVTHPYSTYSLTLEYPVVSNSSTDGEDAKARFCYQVSNNGRNLLAELTSTNLGDQPKFIVVKTANVKATIKGGPPTRTFRIYNSRQYDIPFRLYEAPNILAIPPQGFDITDIASQPGFITSKAAFLPNYVDAQALAVYTGIRTALGFVPIVSETIDVAEFALATATGRDFLGRRVTKEEKFMLGISIIMDFAPMSGSALLKVFRRKINSATAVKEAMKTANVTSKERSLVKEAEKLIESGGKATAEQMEAAVAIAKRMPEEHPPIESILNADGNGFTHTELQAGYQMYKRGNKDPLSPIAWARKQTKDRYSDILLDMLGPDFRKATSRAGKANSRTFNLLEVMRPSGLTEELAKQHLAFLLSGDVAKAKKLRRLMEDLKSTDEAVALLARTQMSSGRFNNIKGVIGEIFALPMMQKILKESHPDAHLFTGVIMRRAGGGEKEFADNIIAIQRGNDLEIRLVFEVKSGDRGGGEATQQIFDWIEGRLETGDQIIIPAGSKYYDAAGKEMTLAKEIRANYKRRPSPNDASAGVGMVEGLAKADRRILAAKGTSQLGLGNADQTYAKIHRDDLPVTSEEIDYLSAQLVPVLAKLGVLP